MRRPARSPTRTAARTAAPMLARRTSGPPPRPRARPARERSRHLLLDREARAGAEQEAQRPERGEPAVALRTERAAGDREESVAGDPGERGPTRQRFRSPRGRIEVARASEPARTRRRHDGESYRRVPVRTAYRARRPWPGGNLSSLMSDFLHALESRVLLLDGAFGTWVQGQDLGPEDFGGEPRGVQREPRAHPPGSRRPDAPRVLRGRCRRGRDRDVRGIRAGARGVRHRGRHLRPERRRGPRSPGRSRPSSPPPSAPAGSSARSGPGTRLPRSARSRSPSCATTTSSRPPGCIEGGADVLLIETVYDLLQAKSAIVACRRAMSDAGRTVPLMVQVTMETTGRMLVGSEIGAARHRARGDEARRARPELRDRSERDDRAPPLPQGARAHVPLVPPERGAAVGRRRAHALRPHARRSRRRARALRPRVRHQHRRRLLRHDARAPAAPSSSASARDPVPVAARPGLRARLLEHLLARAVPPGARVPRGRRAHQRQRLPQVPRRDARRRLGHLRADGPRAGEGRRARPRRLRGLRRPRRHRRHGGDRVPLRDPGCAPARVRLHRAVGHRGRAAALRAARRCSTRRTSRTARPRDPGWTG